ncbi:MAG: hypothetical protein AAF846_26920 [Chloroflexota bacterium]
MFKLTPQGGDGAYSSASLLHLGELYCFTASSKQISLNHNMPQRWYGMVEAYLVGSTRKETQLVIQLLPDLKQHLQLNLQDTLYLIDNGMIHLKHYPSNPLSNPYETLKHMLITTREHSLLIAKDPELWSEWKLLCLYELPEQRVKLSYEWLTNQEWFDIEPRTIDWTLLIYQLLDLVDAPNDDDYDENGGSFPIRV